MRIAFNANTTVAVIGRLIIVLGIHEPCIHSNCKQDEEEVAC